MLVCSILHTSIELANIAHTGIVHTNIVYTSIEAEGFCRGVFTAGLVGATWILIIRIFSCLGRLYGL